MRRRSSKVRKIVCIDDQIVFCRFVKISVPATSLRGGHRAFFALRGHSAHMATPTPFASAFAGVLQALDDLPARIKKLILPACGMRDTEHKVAAFGFLLQNHIIDPKAPADSPDSRPWLENGKDMQQFQRRVHQILTKSSHTAALKQIAMYNGLIAMGGGKRW